MAEHAQLWRRETCCRIGVDDAGFFQLRQVDFCCVRRVESDDLARRSISVSGVESVIVIVFMIGLRIVEPPSRYRGRTKPTEDEAK
jgi:hypothetical protein